MTQAALITQIDVRQIAPRERHARIFAAFDSLATGQAMELVNDHDPAPLHQHFQSSRPGQFDWTYAQQGPQTWRVEIARIARGHADGACCGACGGA